MPSRFRLRLSRGLAARWQGERYRRGTIYSTDDPEQYLSMIRSGLFIEADPRLDAPPARPAEPGVSITIVRSRGLGDVLMALPAVQELARRHPWATVSYAVPDEMTELISAQPWIRATSWSDSIEARRIDLSDYPERSGKERRWTRQALFAHALGFPLDDTFAASLRKPLHVEEHWRTRFREQFSSARPMVLLAPLASVVDRTIDAELADDISTAFAERGWTVVGVGTHALEAEDPGPMRVEELAGLMSLADLVIATDSGPLHLAGHLEIPVVGLFTNWPAWTRMRGYRGIALEQEWLTCWPCFGRGCPPHWCTGAFQVEEILASAAKLLPRGSLAPSTVNGPFLARAQEFHGA